MRQDMRAIQLVWLSRTGLTNLNSGEGGSNLVDIKKFRYGGQEFPYVSGQAMRFYLKEAIRRHLKPEEACVPDEQGETCGRIAECVLCDLFGFMWTERAERRGEGRSHVRTSPVKVSPAIGLQPLDATMTMDFLTRRPRGTIIEAGQEEEARSIVNVELAVNIYKAGICVDVMRVGREEELIDLVGAEKARRRFPIRSVQLRDYVDESERVRRIALLLDAIKDFSDYSKQARLLTDFTPDLLLIALQNNYSHRLQKAIELQGDGTARVNVERLRQIIAEAKEDLLIVDNKPALWAGIIDGIVENAEEVRQALEKAGVPILTPREAINAVKRILESA
ncbi:type I-B CRISPR-associated protein Cas7/Cst2/DevR [Fervidibacter sacchari]|uniref:CRISPR-associated protein Cst2 n=1 Tax=Candidatus Fervidibacter sacchari TaxID=1448929 RepID=A0ABT2ERT4_9BACT|nr:type I-B CRISPR-associated protein Cas7/Cst2/DevR [Candidatus Fervidibacter sacchari]MCS3920677.1 CRISPR-associated protein Cst2 [Candidatus Fervidibacter sacchari]WKU16349.1 type I-B CRISPR-associated protein Cas7/Cst2/DevR [Candidatus Fervidibacter sacchari]